jgi:TPR repeat protein
MKQPYVELLGLLLCAIPGTAFAQGATAQSDSDTVQSLKTMDKTYTGGHPDVVNEFAGMHRYAAGDYAGAMKSFLIAASYADKPSQLSIGLMYLNGQGVQKDPATAWAWISIAAERGYPQFVTTRDDLWLQLKSGQRQRAKATEQQLDAQYGDAVAQPRMLQALQQSAADTGGAKTNADASMDKFCVQNKAAACADLYAKWFWDPNNYFAGRDAAWKRITEPGTLQNVHRNKVNGGSALSEQP